MVRRVDRRFRPFVTACLLLGMGLGTTLEATLIAHLLGKWLVHVHLVSWVITTVGLLWLWRCVRKAELIFSDRAFLGAMFLGWGVVNSIGGWLLDRWSFVLFGIAMSIAGYRLFGKGVRPIYNRLFQKPRSA